METAGARTHIVVPMLKEGELIGAIVTYREEVRPFTSQADRVADEFRQPSGRHRHREHAAAQRIAAIARAADCAANVLSVISSSPGEQPVFQAMLENAVRICEAKFGSLFRFDGEKITVASGRHGHRNHAEFRALARSSETGHSVGPRRADKESNSYRRLCRRTLFLWPNAATLGGARSTLCVPMLKEEALIGAIYIYRT